MLGSLWQNGIARLSLITGLLLLIPLIAMQFSEDVNWTLSDFVVMGSLIFGTGLIYELIIKRMANNEHRAGAVFALVIIFFLVWAELAVGLFGTPFAGN